MSGPKNNIEDNMIEAYFKIIGEAHIDNIIAELDEHSEDINSVIVPKSLDSWFDSFQKRINHESIRNRRIWQIKQISARASIFAIIIFISIFMVTLSVDAFRVRVFNLFQDRNDSFMEIKFTEDESNQEIPDIDIDSYYYLSYLPSEYHYKQHLVAGDGITIVYTDGKDVITFDQDTSGTSYQIDIENSETHNVIIGDNVGQLIIKSERTMLFWTDSYNSFLIIGMVPEQELIKMANNLKKIN